MPNPIEVHDEPYVLAGRIVTMDGAFTVMDSGRIYIRQGTIAAVADRNMPPPVGFENAPIIETNGTIFPGLIELHNHLSYNILPLWNVPRQFKSRDQWRNHPQKRSLVTAPMAVLANTPQYPEAIVRYVECKCLVAGVTTSQGISLYGVNLNDYYRGIIRNVESPSHPQLPKAYTKIDDVDDEAVEQFWERLQGLDGTLLLHLCEGIDDKTHGYFKALKRKDDTYAINDRLTGIHSTGLAAKDFDEMKASAGIVWSPLSNLLLYGATTNIKAAHAAGVTIALGSDWSPTGSKNLLSELKVAYLVAQETKLPLEARDIVAMVTRNPAKILKWDGLLGSIEPGKQADLLVIDSARGEPYKALIDATEKQVNLVLVNGIPRYGVPNLMQTFGTETERIQIGSDKPQERWFNLRDDDAIASIRDLTLADASERLAKGLREIARLAEALENEDNPVAMLARGLNHAVHTHDSAAALESAFADVRKEYPGVDLPDTAIFLELHEDEFEGFMTHAERNFQEAQFGFARLPDLLALESGVSYSSIVAAETYRLDPLTIVDDDEYFKILVLQQNLPNFIKEKLPQFYNVTIEVPAHALFLMQSPSIVRPQFYGTTSIKEFRQQKGFLSLSERRLIVEQALVLLEKFYVHLPLKRAMHAVDPIQRLRLMLFALDQQMIMGDNNLLPEIDFHVELLEIFTALRDLHTSYVLPAPYRGKVAFLPFVIEEYYDKAEKRWHYIVSKVAPGYSKDNFTEEVEVLYWNGIPIERAIHINAQRYAGSNQAARHSRGLYNLTIRPLGQGVPPDEEWVTIKYKKQGSDELDELQQDWLVFSPSLLRPTFYTFDEVGDTATAMALDWHNDTVHEATKAIFVPDVIEADRIAQTTNKAQKTNRNGYLETHMPTVFRAMPYKDCGYIRIFTFNVESAKEFIEEFVRLTDKLPEGGLIIDIRANPGGLIPAAECLLQTLSPEPIMRGRAQFINSNLTLELCNLHKVSPTYGNLRLEPWLESIQQSIRTGSVYSQAIPITKTCDTALRVKQQKKLLIVDAMCYSAADIFAAGFQDHHMGEIIGTSENTGAGGANVWDYEVLERLMSISELQHARLKPLPHGATMRVAIRRTLRVGEQEGMPIEDMGIFIKPELYHPMTKDDLLKGNKDLLAFAYRCLQAQQVKGASASL